MVDDGMVDVVGHIGLQHLAGDGAMVGDAEQFADVVAERRHHFLVVGAVAAGQGGGHQAMDQLIGAETHLDGFQPLQ